MGDFLIKIVAWFLVILVTIGLPLYLIDSIWGAITGHDLIDKCHFDDDDSDDNDSSL